jgi:hypothetical protein
MYGQQLEWMFTAALTITAPRLPLIGGLGVIIAFEYYGATKFPALVDYALTRSQSQASENTKIRRLSAELPVRCSLIPAPASSQWVVSIETSPQNEIFDVEERARSIEVPEGDSQRA